MGKVTDQDVIRQHIVRAVTLILDNEFRVQPRLYGAACEAVMNDMGTGVGLEDYVAMWNGRPSHSGYERWEYARVAGNAVCDLIEEIIIEEHEDSLIKRLLIDVLDLHDSSQREMFGDHYLPDPDDLVDDDEAIAYMAD